MSEDPHEIDVEEIGTWGEELHSTVERDRVIAYAQATNDETPHHLDGRFAPPVYAVVPPFQQMAERTMAVVPDELMLRILHGEHDFHIHRPIRPGDELTTQAKVVGVHGRSSGVVVTTLLECRDARDELVNEQYFSGFFRGGRWDGAAGEPAPGHAFDDALRSRTPDAEIVQKFDEDQTFRYAEAAGDPMPIHLDDDFAKQMGLPGIIVHGLCTMAFTSHAVLSHVSPDDPARLRRLAVRFAAPARPGQTITTRIWRLDESDGRPSYAFETSTDDGTVLIKDGRAEFSQEEQS